MRYMISLKLLNIVKIVEVFTQNVFKLHELSDTIISDHEDQFIVIFWKILYTWFKIKIQLSTTFLLQIVMRKASLDLLIQ